MNRNTLSPGTMIDDGDENWGLVIDPDWTDEEIAERWNHHAYYYGDPVAPPFSRRVLHRHSARQLREEPQAYDDWWSDEGELKASITVAEAGRD